MMNYFQKKKLAFMSIVNRVKGFVRTVTGALPLTLANCVDDKSITDYTIYGNSVQNGTPTPDTPIEVECVGEYDETTGKYKIPIKVSGKNLFDKGDTNIKDGRIFTDGSIVSDSYSSGKQVSGYIPVKENTTYIQSIENTSAQRVGFYDENYKYIGGSANQLKTFTTKEGTKYVRVTFLKDNIDTHMVEEGTTATDYEPYHEPITTNIYLDEPLRKVGDYADYIKSIDLVNGTGTVASVVKEMVVDSSTKLHYSGLSTDSESAVFFNPKDVGSAKSACDVLSNYFPTVETDGCQVWRNTPASNTSHFIKATNEIFEIDETDTTNDLKLKKIKAWLDAQKAINPVLCYYILKTPTETPITLPKIPTFKGTSILTVGTTIQPSNAEIEYYSNVKE